MMSSFVRPPDVRRAVPAQTSSRVPRALTRCCCWSIASILSICILRLYISLNKKRCQDTMHAVHIVSKHRWMSLRRVLAAERQAEALGVSVIARGPGGFVREYQRAGTAARMKSRPVSGYPGQTWGQRRDAFIRRHLPQYLASPTERRRLALGMWACCPDCGAP